MTKLDQLRSCLFLLIKRHYYLDKWIGDESLLSILKSQFGQNELTKSYLNRYISHIGLDTINIFSHKEEYLLYQDQNVRRAYFYIFTSQNLPPNKLSKNDFTSIYFNFRILRSEHNTNQKRKVLSDITTDNSNNTRTAFNIITPEQKIRENNMTKINIGNYFTSITTKKLFGCKQDEEVYDCLSRRIDMFDEILSNNLPIWKVVNKGSKDSELTPSQVITISQRICFLRQAYLITLDLESSERIHFEQCCEMAIKNVTNLGTRI